MFEARTFEDEKSQIRDDYMADPMWAERRDADGQCAYVEWLEYKLWHSRNNFADLAFVAFSFAIGVLITWL